MDRSVRWFAMPVSLQISNIGSEVGRAIKYKNRNDQEKAEHFKRFLTEWNEWMVKQQRQQQYIQQFFQQYYK